MRVISAGKVKDAVVELCIRANQVLRPDVLKSLRAAQLSEKNNKAKNILGAIIKNALLAKSKKLAICQDTGFPALFLEIGQDVMVKGDLRGAILKGVEDGYRKGGLRKSIVRDPLTRGGPEYQGAVIHSEIVRGNKLKITVLPKGFGCENKSQLKMFLPTAGLEEIKRFIVDAVRSAGPDACPPYVVGVGIGGTADYAGLLAKKALLRGCTRAPGQLGRDLLRAINGLNIGPMGLGGKATCLGVNIETFPTHIAGLPVAVNISCHALRSASAVI